jgi:hypothetical protein
VQGESREDRTPCRSARGFFSFERRCVDSALQSWYADSFPRFIERCGELIADEAGDGLEGLILGGSFASNEGSVVMLDGGPLFLSDIDLLLVAATEEPHSRLYSRRSAIGKACENLLSDAKFNGRVDIGVMTGGELAGMSHSPGVFDMRERGVLLHGESELLNRLPSFPAEGIGAAEAVRLLENRMAAFLGARPSTDSPEGMELQTFLYAVSRVYTDIITASLCAAGLYLTGYMARAEFISSSPDAVKVRERLGGSLVSDAVKWTYFKVDPGSRTLWSGDSRASHLWLEAAGDLLAARDRISRMEDVHPPDDRPKYRDLLRSWKGIAMGIPLPGRVRLLAGSLFSGLDPGEHLREESVRLVRHAAEKGTEGVTGGARAGYPHGRGSWESAAAATSSAWRMLVSGREEHLE